jgi:hypothetical protein
MWEDPLVEEIRKRRRELISEYDIEIHSSFDKYRFTNFIGRTISQ